MQDYLEKSESLAIFAVNRWRDKGEIAEPPLFFALVSPANIEQISVITNFFREINQKSFTVALLWETKE